MQNGDRGKAARARRLCACSLVVLLSRFAVPALAADAYAENASPPPRQLSPTDQPLPPVPATEWTVDQKLLLVDGVALAGMVALGLAAWWGEGSDLTTFRFNTSDGWFGREDAWGGADKLGHAFSTYAVSRGLANVYRAIGLDRERATRRGVLGGWVLVSLIEVGDAFSRYGFSPRDLVANTAGAGLAWLLEASPTLDRFFDFRLEYWPGRQIRTGDVDYPIVDYSGMRFLLVHKLAGYEKLAGSPLSYLELHGGYYSRGYFENRESDGKRHVFFGLSLNFSKIFGEFAERSGGGRRLLKSVSTFLRYYQPPSSHLAVDRQLD